jgi:uncharacterized protein
VFQNNKQLILKLTRGCSRSCEYCYVLDKEKYADEVISDETFNRILDLQFSENNYHDVPDNFESIVFSNLSPEEKQKRLGPIQPFNLVFHGGEPLRVGKERFSKFCRIATQKARQYGKYVSLSIQTNGDLIDPEWCEIFRRYNVSVGTSWDGYGGSSDERGGGAKVYNNIALMISHGIVPGVIMILHKSNYKHVVQNLKMLELVGVKSVKVNRGVDIAKVEGSDFELNPDELMEASKEICYHMFSHKIVEDVLYNKMKKFLANVGNGSQNRGSICYTRYCGSGNAILEVEPDGTVLMCGRNSKQHEIVSMDIGSRDLCELKAIAQQWGFQKGKVTSVVDLMCNTCAATTTCDGGCISFSYQKFGIAKIDVTTCEYNKKLYGFFSENYDEIKKYCGQEKQNPYLGWFV